MNYELRIKDDAQNRKTRIKTYDSDKRGFVAIEAIIVIILVVLTLSTVFVFIQESRAKNRDFRREQDIKAIRNALDVYNTGIGTFPTCSEEIVINGENDCLTQKLIAEEAIRMMPNDPLHGGAGVCDAPDSYVYCYQASMNGLDYILKYNLETDNVAGKNAGWHSVSP